ncbi:MAG: peptidoglycan DD-metalloendopeptidase family protein [Patescibacteria group bacterium]
MKKTILIFLVVLGLLFQPVFAFAETTTTNQTEIDQLKREIEANKSIVKQLEDTIAKYNTNISQKQLEANSLKNQLGILDNHIAKAQADIDLTQTQIKQTQLEIAALQLIIQDKENVIAKQKGIIAKMVQNINAEKQKNYLEILLTNNNLTDFFNQLQYTINVYTDLGKSVKVLRLAKEDLQKQQQQLKDKEKNLEDLQKQMQEKMDALTNQSNAKQQLLVSTKSSELKYRTLLSSLKQQYQTIVSQINSDEQSMRKKLEANNQIADTSVGDLQWPVPSHVVNAIFHDPDYPFKNVMQHSGIDVRAAQGTPIRAAASGYVATAKRCSLSSCYSYVLIIHTASFSTLYGHLSRVDVTPNQFVTKGDVIGMSGGTPGMVGSGPFVTGPHLHFETRLNGIPVNPFGYINP